MTLATVTLDDKYVQEAGRIYLSGIQALVRLPLMQRQRDKAAGLNTGGFISGYRGSPLGVYDNALWHARRFLERANVYFQPGVNEDLAATSVWGSQQTTLFPGATVDGVFGIWYGKGPGVDRSIDALKHANAAGTAPHGGVLAIAVDQNMRPRRGIFVDFFGHPACTTPAAAVYALRAGASIVAAFPGRRPRGARS